VTACARKPPKWGCCALSVRGELGPHLTRCRLGWGLPPYQVASWSIQPFGHNSPTLQTGQTDRRQQSSSIGRTITDNGRPKTKGRISRILRHPVWKWGRPILVSALRKFVNYLFTWTLTMTYWLTDRPGTHMGQEIHTTTYRDNRIRQIPRRSKQFIASTEGCWNYAHVYACIDTSGQRNTLNIRTSLKCPIVWRSFDTRGTCVGDDLCNRCCLLVVQKHVWLKTATSSKLLLTHRGFRAQWFYINLLLVLCF